MFFLVLLSIKSNRYSTSFWRYTMTPFINNIKWDRIWIHFYISDLPSNSTVYISSLNGKYIYPLKVAEDNPSVFLLNITNPGNCKMLPPGIFKLVFKENEQNKQFTNIEESAFSERISSWLARS